jgi:hypothetical protein
MEAKMINSEANWKCRILKGSFALVLLAVVGLSVGKPPAPPLKVVQASQPKTVPTAPIESKPQVATTKSMTKITTQRLMKPTDLIAYQRAIRETALMVSNSEAQSLAASQGLQILNLTWEDTGRYKGSAVGPNISDMTIQVALRDPKTQQLAVTCMPVIRYPNFQDKSCDLDPRDFTLLVGNQAGQELKRISLFDFLDRPTDFLSNPDSWKSPKKTLLATRDSKVLVSAQACFLPVSKKGKAEFNPVLFNYQSYKENPAVLTLLVTREGSSVTVIDNTRDAFETGSVWGQRLFHNENGQRASLSGERESEFQTKSRTTEGVSVARPGGDSTGESGLNMVLLVQVPLKQKLMKRSVTFGALMCMAPSAVMESERRSDVEDAVIGHGELEGPFTEIDNLSIERDERFPVRVTVQFYKATSNGVVSKGDLQAIKEQIDRVYAQSDYAGSLVTQGETGRITEYEGVKQQPPNWWERFWEHHEQNTGDSREVAIAKLRELLGKNFERRPVSDLYLRSLLRKKA